AEAQVAVVLGQTQQVRGNAGAVLGAQRADGNRNGRRHGKTSVGAPTQAGHGRACGQAGVEQGLGYGHGAPILGFSLGFCSAMLQCSNAPGGILSQTGTAVVALTRSSTKLVLQSCTLGCLSRVSMMKRL